MQNADDNTSDDDEAQMNSNNSSIDYEHEQALNVLNMLLLVYTQHTYYMFLYIQLAHDANSGQAANEINCGLLHGNSN